MTKSAAFLVALSSLLALGACQPGDEGAEAVPTLHALVPDFGSIDGNETVLLLGAGFGETPSVSFGNVQAPGVVRISSTELHITIPSGVEGPADVAVTNSTGASAHAPSAFTYQDPLLSPALTGLSPDTGLWEGGTAVTLSGDRFQDGAEVRIGGMPAGQVVLVDEHTLTCVTPASLGEGTLDVLVENCDGRRAVLSGAFFSVGLTPAESEILALVNQERAKEGLEPLVLNLALVRASRDHSRDMIELGFFDHIDPGGLAPWDRAVQRGYSSYYVGENIAAGYGTAEAVMSGWMDSPGHRANILNPNFRELGVGVAEGAPMGTTWTQIFGAP